MFPIRDHNPSGKAPVITWALIAINIAVYLLGLSAAPGEMAQAQMFGTWGLVPAAISSGYGYGTFLTSMFLHGGLMHLAGNMLFLWIFGDNLEDRMGRARYALSYLAAGFAAGMAQVLADPSSALPMVGASGAIAGVMGGYLLLFPRARVDVLFILIVFWRVFSVPAWAMLGVWFALQLFSGVTTPADAAGVAYWAHAGGFVAGVVLTAPIWLRLGGPAFWSTTLGLPPNPVAEYRLRATTIPRVPRRK